MSENNDVINQLSTMGDFVRWGASRFNEAGLAFGHGADNALDESFYLVTFALHLPHDIPTYMVETKLSQQERTDVFDLLNKRVATQLPAAYLTNEAWFAGVPFYVDERVLIPRSPFAELIQEQFSPWLMEEEIHNILELCTGSGCIAIACAYTFEQAQVDASDVSSDALAVAEINRRNHGLEDRLTLIKSNLFESIPAKRYDVIISNPPYVSAREMQQLPAEFDFEPGSLALAAGETGLDIVLPMLQQAGDYLTDEGILIVEVGYSKPVLEQLLPEVPFFWVDFEFGGDGVFVLTASQLRKYQVQFKQADKGIQ